MALRRVVGVDAEFGIAAVARASRNGIVVEVAVRSPGADIESLARAAHAPEKSVVLGLGGPNVFLRTMRLPGDLDRKAIAETVKWQLADVVPDRVIRHCVTGKVNDHWCVVVGGVPKETVHGLKAGTLDLRVAALWRGAIHFLGKIEDGPMVIVEQTASGCRVVGGRNFLEFAREITGDSDAELQRTLLYCRSELGEDLRVLYVGRDLPEETVAVGLALHYHAEPRFNFLVKEKLMLANLTIGKRFLRFAAVGAVLALLPYVVAYGYRIQTSEYVRRINALAPQVEKYAFLKAEREKYEDWIAIVDSFTTSPAWPLMDDIRHAVPTKCWLTSLKTERPAQTPAQRGSPPATAENTSNDIGQNDGTEKSGNTGQSDSGKSGNTVQNTQVKRVSTQTASQLPARASKVVLEGYSLDAASVGLLRDNLEALPWCDGIVSVSVRWDDQIGAYSFKVVAAVKQPDLKEQKGVKK